ncbi:MAG: HU family DNA-binding protein [Deltaproteobacteria bacterium]|nr:HU family DNA-binding protein [Deltaproteobacteria bacterium]
MATPSDPSTLTRADLAEALQDALGLPQPMAGRLVAEIFESTGAALQDPADGRVQITGFGTFEVLDRGPRPARNPRTNEVVPLAARRVVRFRAASGLRALLRKEEGP